MSKCDICKKGIGLFSTEYVCAVCGKHICSNCRYRWKEHSSILSQILNVEEVDSFFMVHICQYVPIVSKKWKITANALKKQWTIAIMWKLFPKTIKGKRGIFQIARKISKAIHIGTEKMLARNFVLSLNILVVTWFLTSCTKELNVKRPVTLGKAPTYIASGRVLALQWKKVEPSFECQSTLPFFDDEKSRYWQDRFKAFTKSELAEIYGR